MSEITSLEHIQTRILVLRDQRVLIDADLGAHDEQLAAIVEAKVRFHRGNH